jgi:hypothetical protein
MDVTATLKFVLRDLPPVQERGSTVSMTLTTTPKGLPKELTLESSPLTVVCANKQWRTACTRAAQIRDEGAPPLLIVEAHVAARQGTLCAIIKGIQVVPGKVPTTPVA